MKGVISWENMLLTIFLWFFIGQLLSAVIEKYKISNKTQTNVSIVGVIVILYIIYYDRYYK